VETVPFHSTKVSARLPLPHIEFPPLMVEILKDLVTAGKVLIEIPGLLKHAIRGETKLFLNETSNAVQAIFPKILEKLKGKIPALAESALKQGARIFADAVLGALCPVKGYKGFGIDLAFEMEQSDEPDFVDITVTALLAADSGAALELELGGSTTGAGSFEGGWRSGTAVGFKDTFKSPMHRGWRYRLKQWTDERSKAWKEWKDDLKLPDLPSLPFKKEMEAAIGALQGRTGIDQKLVQDTLAQLRTI